MKKYELTEETKEYRGLVLHRIKALKDFGDVKAGDLGGWIEIEVSDDTWISNGIASNDETDATVTNLPN